MTIEEEWDMMDLSPTEIPTKVLEYLRYDAKDGETYKGFTLLRTEEVEYIDEMRCRVTLFIRTPAGEEVEV